MKHTRAGSYERMETTSEPARRGPLLSLQQRRRLLYLRRSGRTAEAQTEAETAIRGAHRREAEARIAAARERKANQP